MITLRKLPRAAHAHPDPLLAFYYGALAAHWPRRRWATGRTMAFRRGRDEAAWLGIPTAEWRIIRGWVPPEHYVPMAVRRGIHRLVNPAATPIRANLLKDKAAFARFAAAKGLAVPFTVAAGLPSTASELLARGEIVLKPSFSSKGKGVIRARRDGAGWALTNGERLCETELAARIEQAAARGGVAQEAFSAHPMLSGLSPGALPTARVMTFRCGRSEPVAGMLIVRLGGGAVPVDNFDHGGLIALPSANAELSQALAKTPKGLVRVAAHPHTGEPIARRLPTGLLEAARDLAREAHARLDEGFAVVGWDVGLSDRGAVLIEGNWNPSTQVPQCAAGAGLSQLPIGGLYERALRGIGAERWRRAKTIELDW